MALTPQDQAFYEEKLGWKSFLYLFVATVIVGAVVWPLLLFLLDWSAGHAGAWTVNILFSVSMSGFLLGTIVSVVMYLLFKFFLWMGWLPSRR